MRLTSMRTKKQKIGGYCESFINILPKINIKPFKEYCLTIGNLDIRIRNKKNCIRAWTGISCGLAN